MTDTAVIDRDLMQAMRRGALRKCPSCGDGALFNGYLKVRDECPVCHTELHHQRADDGPAYLTILIVAHLATILLLPIYVIYRPSSITLLWVFCGGAIALSLVLLPLIKGAFVGMQWAKRMHGFGFDETDRHATRDFQP